MSADSFDVLQKQTLEEAFPEVPLPTAPFGGRVLVQLRRLPQKTKGGIVLVEDTRDTAKWNNQVGKIVALGPLAFRNRETGEPWPEGVWAAVGDYVRLPRWDGDRVEVPVRDADPIIFVTLGDHQLLGKVLGDPLEQRIYVL